ncbi:MAG TPA: metal-dependent transcriptional regulator, partial [Phycisphaerae bacterium]|nr:metal-dependent transcriptional regulator [Phycisphaerae bacterium]
MAIDKIKLTASQEDYLEAIWALIWKEGIARVGDIAEWLGVSTPSVIGALKTLAKR